MTESTRGPSNVVFYTQHAFVGPEGPTADTETVRSQLTLTVAARNATVDLSWERIQRMLSDRRVVEQRVRCVDDVNGCLLALPPALEQCAERVQKLYLDCFTRRISWDVQDFEVCIIIILQTCGLVRLLCWLLEDIIFSGCDRL